MLISYRPCVQLTFKKCFSWCILSPVCTYGDALNNKSERYAWSIHRTEEFRSRLCFWLCPVDGWGKRSSQPAASLPDSKEHHPPRLSFRYRHTPINTTTKLSGAFQFNPKRPLHVSYLMCSQVNSQRSCSKWRPVISPSTSPL